MVAMASIESVSQGRITVSGELGFHNVVALKDEGARLLAQSDSKVEIDLSGVTRAGSAAVSLLLSWLRYASANGVELVFSHTPADLFGVAQVSGLEQILPIAAQ